MLHPLASAWLFVYARALSARACRSVSEILECYCGLDFVQRSEQRRNNRLLVYFTMRGMIG
jgi:hypothetical protein